MPYDLCLYAAIAGCDLVLTLFQYNHLAFPMAQHLSPENSQPTSPFHIRVAEPSDIPQLHTLIELSIRQLSRDFYTAAEIDGSVGFLFGPDTQLIADRTYFVALAAAPPSSSASSTDEIVGCGGWSFRKTIYGSDRLPNREPEKLDPQGGDAAKIRAIFVHPSWTRRGLGTLIIRHCEREAIDAGFVKAEMGATLMAVRIYARCGYRRTGEENVALPNGEELRVVRMEKEL